MSRFVQTHLDLRPINLKIARPMAAVIHASIFLPFLRLSLPVFLSLSLSLCPPPFISLFATLPLSACLPFSLQLRSFLLLSFSLPPCFFLFLSAILVSLSPLCLPLFIFLSPSLRFSISLLLFTFSLLLFPSFLCHFVFNLSLPLSFFLFSRLRLIHSNPFIISPLAPLLNFHLPFAIFVSRSARIARIAETRRNRTEN